MQTRVLGRTGEEVSLLGFGAMRLPLTNPDDPGSIDAPQSLAMLHRAVERGVNYVDTAYNYHGQQSESFVGMALREGLRSRVKVATKLPTWLLRDRAHMDEILATQLERLGVEQIDFYLAHNLNHGVWPRTRDMGMLDFLDQAQRDGRIKHVGFSYHDNFALFEEILAAYDWSFTQLQYNYLDTEFQAGARGVALAAAKGLGVVGMEPLRGGLLTQRLPDDIVEYLRGVRPEWSLAEWGLRWVFEHREIGVVLSGMSTMAQVEENLATAANPTALTAGDKAALAEVRRRLLARIKVDCTGCGYCLPCPHGVNIQGVFPIYNDYYMVDSEAQRQAAAKTYSLVFGEAGGADGCVSCGVCEPLCPQGIAIGAVMPEVARVFQG